MKVNNLNNLNNIKYINNYAKSNQKMKNDDKEVSSDKCEISSIGKALNNLSIEDSKVNFDLEKDIEALKNKVSSGKYVVDTKALAEKILDAMKGRA